MLWHLRWEETPDLPAYNETLDMNSKLELPWCYSVRSLFMNEVSLTVSITLQTFHASVGCAHFKIHI